ncbi:hypothetical protein P154DRAFT_214472 [Amniculicola lignicola CBS 123094]|uniref:Uncharacterized protein n=1 Tax=Amniculicola lignicola CBS 123094 TaxID=1392246 RepID=A0A6A5VS62_9PLEO|nr:hypothetical protein P154DRAFT_214472 [Amniculicola lignicola CBS 123094]
MSTPAGQDTTKDLDRRRSLGKYVKRMSSVFKRDKPSKSSAATTSAAASSSAPPAEKKETTTAAPPAPAVAAPAAPAAPSAPVTQHLNRSALQQERARALFAKYGLTLESHEWIATPVHPISVQRVEKPIRMRVHRTCHRCGTTYGSDKACAKCEHRRCKKCPRYPKKKMPADKAKDVEAPQKPKRKKLLTIPTRDGKELAYQTPTQRVRRTCHKCQELFIPPTATVCKRCQHNRCTKCPREPAKLTKWPNGYPGDVDPDSETEVERELDEMRRIWRKPRTRVRWECEECHSLFLDGSPQCPGCGHERCEKCTRAPLKRSKKEREFDPEVVRAVEEKLKALAVKEDPPASPPGAI